MGRLTPDQAIDGLLAQGLWLAVGFLVIHFGWSRASARYSAVGA
jgi:ABC-type uncharacterized transport system permease subunit